jgi:hypothetical protein
MTTHISALCAPSSNETKKRKKVRNKIDYWKARGRVAFLEVANSSFFHRLAKSQPLQQRRSITPRNIAASFSPRIMSTTKYEGKCFMLSLFILSASLFYSHLTILNLPQTSLWSTLTTCSSRAISSLLFTTKSRCPLITTCEMSFALISITSVFAVS